MLYFTKLNSNIQPKCVQILNKEVAVKPKFAIHNDKSEVSFSLCKPLYKNIDNRQEPINRL